MYFHRKCILTSLNSSTISSGELTCTPNAFRLVEHTNRKAGIMQHSTIAVRQISRCYNERPLINLAQNIHTTIYVTCDRNYLAHFYAKIAWHQMLGTCGLSSPCSHELAYVCLATCHLVCHSPNPFCLTRVSYLKRSILILSVVYPTLSAVPPCRRVYRPIDTNLQGVTSLESINCLRRYTRNYYIYLTQCVCTGYIESWTLSFFSLL